MGLRSTLCVLSLTPFFVLGRRWKRCIFASFLDRWLDYMSSHVLVSARLFQTSSIRTIQSDLLCCRCGQTRSMGYTQMAPCSTHSTNTCSSRLCEFVGVTRFFYRHPSCAICDSFSHGANDVANAMGPFASIYFVYTTGEVRKDGCRTRHLRVSGGPRIWRWYVGQLK